MQSIARAMNIIHILSEQSTEHGMSISALAKASDLPLSTLHRILKAMIKQRMVEQDEQTKLYRLGSIWLEYGLKSYDSMDYITTIRPELDRLSKEVNESVYLSKPLHVESIVIERIDSEANPIRMYDQLGIRIPLHIGAANKAMLAAMSPEKSLPLIEQLVAPSEQQAFKEELLKIEQQHYAESHGERTDGTSSVAAPILNGLGEVIGAVSIGFVTFTATPERIQQLIQHVRITGENISAKMGYRR